MTAKRENDELRVRAMEMALACYGGQGLTPEELVRAAEVIYRYLVGGAEDKQGDQGIEHPVEF